MRLEDVVISGPVSSAAVLSCSIDHSSGRLTVCQQTPSATTASDVATAACSHIYTPPAAAAARAAVTTAADSTTPAPFRPLASTTSHAISPAVLLFAALHGVHGGGNTSDDVPDVGGMTADVAPATPRHAVDLCFTTHPALTDAVCQLAGLPGTDYSTAGGCNVSGDQLVSLRSFAPASNVRTATAGASVAKVNMHHLETAALQDDESSSFLAALDGIGLSQRVSSASVDAAAVPGSNACADFLYETVWAADIHDTRPGAAQADSSQYDSSSSSSSVSCHVLHLTTVSGSTQTGFIPAALPAALATAMLLCFLQRCSSSATADRTKQVNLILLSNPLIAVLTLVEHLINTFCEQPQLAAWRFQQGV